MEIFALDWEKLFVPSGSLLNIMLRGTIMYLALYFLLRFIMQRETGMVGITDILVIVLLADAAQNAMADGYESVTEGLVLVATIIFWSWTLEKLGFSFPRLRWLIKPRPIAVIEDGRLISENLKRELLTEEELGGLLREKGVSSIEEVDRAYVESDGQLSVLRKDGQQVDGNKKKAR